MDKKLKKPIVKSSLSIYEPVMETFGDYITANFIIKYIRFQWLSARWQLWAIRYYQEKTNCSCIWHQTNSITPAEINLHKETLIMTAKSYIFFYFLRTFSKLTKVQPQTTLSYKQLIDTD